MKNFDSLALFKTKIKAADFSKRSGLNLVDDRRAEPLEFKDWSSTPKTRLIICGDSYFDR